MIKDALALLGDYAVEANKSETVFENRSSKSIRYADGTIQEFRKDFPDRRHTVGTLVDLIALANRFKDEGETPVVWYGPKAVLLVINDSGYRNDTAMLALSESTLFRSIKALDPRSWYDAKAFVRLLRVDLFGALDPATLLAAVKKVKFESGSKTTAENSRVKESLGREISAQVSAASELPEYVTLTTPAYTTPGVETSVGIRAAVEVDPHKEQFQLVVLPDEVSLAYEAVMSAVADKLRGSLKDGIPCYRSES